MSMWMCQSCSMLSYLSVDARYRRPDATNGTHVGDTKLQHDSSHPGASGSQREFDLWIMHICIKGVDTVYPLKNSGITSRIQKKNRIGRISTWRTARSSGKNIAASEYQTKKRAENREQEKKSKKSDLCSVFLLWPNSLAKITKPKACANVSDGMYLRTWWSQVICQAWCPSSFCARAISAGHIISGKRLGRASQKRSSRS